MSGSKKPVLILPSETQSREFDPKLLMACIAAERGHKVVVGSRMHMHSRIATLPVGIYLAKDVARTSVKIFGILERLGHVIVGWDEEVLFYSDLGLDLYLRKRTAPGALRRLAAFMTWGDKDKAMLAQAPGFDHMPLVATGNPRVDLLRAEVRGFFQPDVDALHKRFGRYILINTNFGRLNHFNPASSLTPSAAGALALRNMEPDDIPLPFWLFRERIFNAFREILPRLAAAFPDRRIVVRPHPAENLETWRRAAAGHDNVTVLHEGGIAPWLMGAAAVIHNGCTTGLEAFLVGTPVIAYMPEASDEHDIPLPNDVSLQIGDFDSLVEQVRGFLAGKPADHPPQVMALARRYIANVDGALAADRILDALDALLAGRTVDGPLGLSRRISAHRDALIRAAAKGFKSLMPGHKNSAAYTRHRFPDLSAAEVERRIRRFGAVMGRFEGVHARALSPNIFAIEKGAAAT